LPNRPVSSGRVVDKSWALVEEEAAASFVALHPGDHISWTVERAHGFERATARCLSAGVAAGDKVFAIGARDDVSNRSFDGLVASIEDQTPLARREGSRGIRAVVDMNRLVRDAPCLRLSFAGVAFIDVAGLRAIATVANALDDVEIVVEDARSIVRRCWTIAGFRAPGVRFGNAGEVEQTVEPEPHPVASTEAAT
jgi:hypothetical protein